MRGGAGRWISLIALALALAAAAFLIYRPSAPSAPKPTPPVEPIAKAKPPAVPAEGDPTEWGEVESTHAGELRLEGRVVQDDDDPVAGARVTLGTTPRRVARSGEDGSFFFDGLPGGEYRLIAHTEDAYGGPVHALLTLTSDPVTLRLRQGSRVEVAVTEQATGKPLAGATAELRGLAVHAGRAQADGLATLRGVAPGAYVLVARADGHGEAFQPVTIASQAKLMRIAVALGAAAAISGEVRTEAGAPVADARVFAESTADDGKSSAAREAVRTGADGKFTVANLALGTYRFVASHEDHGPGASEPVTLDGRAVARNVIIVLPPAAEISGKVVDKGGNPVEIADVFVKPRSQGPRDRQRRRVAVSKGGAFVVKGLPRTPVVITAATSAATSEVVELDLGVEPLRAGVVLTLDVDGTITGRVVDSRGEPIGEAEVLASLHPSTMDEPTAAMRRSLAAVTNFGGEFTLGGVVPGEAYFLRARRSGSEPVGDIFNDPRTVKARAGDQNVTIVLPGTGGVKGKVAFADGSVPDMFLVGVGIRAPTPFAGTKGEFEVHDLSPGSVSLQISGPNFDSTVARDLRVDSDQLTDAGTITLKKGRSVTGRVLDRQGAPIEGAEVFAGFRIVGNGAAVTTDSWGAPGASGSTKQTTSGPDGGYVFRGIGARELAVLADHVTAGRSATVRLPASSESAVVDLVLVPTGALEGTVTRGGRPVADVMINASPRSMAVNSNIVVTTGPDGSYRFDRLASDEYVVSAMAGSTPLSGISMNGVAVAVPEGGTATANIELPGGLTTLTINVLKGGGQNVGLAEVMVVSGLAAARTARDIHAFVSELNGGFYSFNLIITPRPTRAKNVPVGKYTVCAIPYPEALIGAASSIVAEFVDDHGEDLPAFCTAIEIAGDAEQEVSLQVALPPAPEAPR